MTITNDLPRTGTGPYSYAMQHDWLQSPEDLRLGNTHGLAQDRQGRIYLAHTVHADSQRRDAICRFNDDGTFIDSWGSEYAGTAHGLEIIDEGERQVLYLTDLKKGLFKTTLDGEVIWQFEKPALYRKFFGLNWRPSNIAVAADGRIFLADGYGTGFIIVISPDGEELDMIGGPGKRPENLIHPHGLGIDRRDGTERLVVADNLDTGLHYLTLDGEHISKDLCHLRHPRHIRWLPDDVMMVPDLGGCVTLLDRDNQLITHLGDSGKAIEELFPLRENASFDPGWFVHPHDAIGLADGSILVAEWVEVGRVTRLIPTNG